MPRNSVDGFINLVGNVESASERVVGASGNISEQAETLRREVGNAVAHIRSS